VNIVAIIPAKAWSRRLPGKNTRLLAGKPLLQYTIEAALGGEITDVRVTSDSDDILRLAERLGARPVTRPPHLSGPDTPLDAVRDHAVGWAGITGTDGTEQMPDAVMMLLPTYPFRSAADIYRACEMLRSGAVWEVRSADMIERCGGLLLPNSWLSAHVTSYGRRQTWFRAGAAGTGTPHSGTPHIGAWVRTDPIRGIDIDTDDDFARAERVIARGGFDFQTGEIRP
jgi:hypothetical protein